MEDEGNPAGDRPASDVHYVEQRTIELLTSTNVMSERRWSCSDKLGKGRRDEGGPQNEKWSVGSFRTLEWEFTLPWR